MHVVIHTPDVVGARMAGPGIRAWHLADEIAKHFPTSLVAQFEDFAPAGESFTPVMRGSAGARKALLDSTVVVGQPTREILALPRRSRKFIFDLFDPVVLELRELYGAHPTVQQRLHQSREWGRLRMALSRGDLLMSATSRQRDFYGGIHCSMGGQARSWLERWIIVPFGIEEDAPEYVEQTAEPTILWGGGLWEWLDPMTAIESVQRLNERGVPCRLLFLGAKRPNRELAAVGLSDEVTEAIERSDGQVVQNREWIPYHERGPWISGSRVSIMLHRRTMEAEFSIRTRLFDALWCRLPIVATEGGFAAEIVEREDLGLVVPASDAAKVADALERLLKDDALHASCVSNLERVRSGFLWSAVTRPLIEAIQQWS